MLIHINLMDNMRRTAVNAEGDKTIGEVLRENGFDTSVGTIMIDGVAVSGNDKVEEVCEDNSYVSLTAKANNALKVQNIGSVCYLTAAITKDTFDAVRKYRKEKLNLTDEKGNVLFTLAYNEGKPTIGEYAAEFSEVTKDGFLALPFMKSKEYVLDHLTGPLLKVQEVEKQVAAASDAIAADKAAVEGMFTPVA